MSLQKLSLYAIAFATCTGLAHGQLDVPELTLGPKPDPLVITPPNHAPTGLVRWFGNARSTPIQYVEEMVWIPDGTRMFTGPGGLGNKRHVWKPSPAGTSVEMEGEINMTDPLVISGDGRWIFGPCDLPDDHMPRLQLHRADTLEGVWSLTTPYHEIRTAAFSKDGKWLALVHNIYRGQGTDLQVYISIIDATTGTRIQVLHPRSGWDEFGRFDSPSLDIAFTGDALLLHPCYDEERRIKRFPIATWKMEFASDALHSGSQKHMLVSNDGRWLVFWGDDAYSVLEFSGGTYVQRFEGEAWTAENENERFNNIRFSPDGTTLVLSGCGKHKVIRLADRMVLHDGADNCLCGEFSPNGRIFWNRCQPFQSIDTRTWQVTSGQYEQHTQEITELAFSLDGKILASASFDSLRLWSTERDAPPLKLVSPRKPARYRSVAWTNDGRELLGGDGKDFCKWRISDSNKTTREIKGSVLFTSPPWRVDTLRYQDLYFIPKTGACLITQSNTRSMVWETRNPSAPSVVKRLESSGYPDGHVAFLPDGTEFFYTEDEHADCKVVAYRQSDGNVRKVAMGTRGCLAGMLPSGGDLVVLESNKVSFVNPHTLQRHERSIVLRGTMSFEISPPKANAVSPDGKWLYCRAAELVIKQGRSLREEFPVLINLQGVGEIIRLEPHLATMRVAVFSPDSSKLAVGHQSGLISLWDVSALAKSSPMKLASQGEPTTPQGPQRVPGSYTIKPLAWSSEWPATSRSTDDGDMRGFSTTGAVVGIESGSEMGRLLVNDAEPKVLAGRSAFQEYVSRTNPGALPSYLSKCDVEMSTPDGRVRIHRQLRGNSRGDLKWLDTFENISEEPQTLTLSYRHKMGGTINDLLVMNRKPTLLGEGQISADGPIHSASMTAQSGDVSRLVGIKFSSPSAPLLPAVRWLETERALVTEWMLRLEPFEKRIIMQDMVHRRLQKGRDSGFVSGVLAWQPTGEFPLLPRLPFLVNFSPFESKNPNSGFDSHFMERQTETMAKEMEMKAMKLDENGYKKDVMGFRWRLTDSAASGMGAEFGAQRIFEVRMDGRPMTFWEPSSTEVPGKPPKRRAQFSALNSPVKVLRESQWKKTDSVFATHDEVVNTGIYPAKCQLQLVVVAQQYFERIEDAQGKVLALTAPTPISSFEGKLAIVAPGETKASILLSLGNPAAKYGAKVRLAANRGLIIAYDLELAPNERVPLMHLAAQRPLNVYKNAQEAFDELATPSPTQRATEADLPSPANWNATTP